MCLVLYRIFSKSYNLDKWQTRLESNFVDVVENKWRRNHAIYYNDTFLVLTYFKS